MNQYAMVTCPMCNGHKQSVVHVDGIRDGQRFGEWRKVACDFCDGTGHVRQHQAEKYQEGQLMMVDRRARGMSLRAEAERLGITAKQLSDREHGRA